MRTRAAGSGRFTACALSLPRGGPHNYKRRGGWERVRVGCRGCGGVMHGSLGSAVAFHDERQNTLAKLKAAITHDASARPDESASEAASPAAVRFAVTEA
jgi:hypothetical protein